MHVQQMASVMCVVCIDQTEPSRVAQYGVSKTLQTIPFCTIIVSALCAQKRAPHMHATLAQALPEVEPSPAHLLECANSKVACF